MAGADSPVTGRRPLSIVACVPLPYRAGSAEVAQNGVALFYAMLLPRLAARGHRIRVLHEAPPSRAPGPRRRLDWAVPGLHVDGFAFEYWPGRSPPTEAYDARVAAPLARRLAERRWRRPDVVLVGREVVAAAAAAACADLGLPAVLIAHGVTTAAMEEGDYPRAAAARVLEGVRAMRHVVAVAAHLEATLRLLSVASVSTIPNVVDTERFQPDAAEPALRAALGIPPGAPVVGHASNLTDHKRAADLMAAMPGVLRRAPDTVLLIIGDGAERAALEAQARALGVAAQVRFLGEIPHHRMPAHLALCDVVAMPSQRETAALVYRETQACGRVLVASDIPAAREAVAHRVTGILFPRGDIEGLAGSLWTLLIDPPRRARLGAQAREAVLTPTLDEWTSRYEAVLQAAAGDEQ